MENQTVDSAGREPGDEGYRIPFAQPKTDYYSFINRGMDTGSEYSSQITLINNHDELGTSLNNVHVARVDENNLVTQLELAQPNGFANDIDSYRADKNAFKNLIVLSVSFTFVYTAFVSLQSLQSSLNADSGIGVASLCSVYSSTVLSCLFTPFVIQRLTTKWTMVVAFMLFLVYVGSNFYPSGFLLIPASILLGLITGPMWSAQATYLTTMALRYALATLQSHDYTLNKFNGIFIALFQTSQIWAHMISAITLSSSTHNMYENDELSQSLIRTHVVPNFEVEFDKSQQILKETYRNMTCGALDCGLANFGLSEQTDNVPHHLDPIPIHVMRLLLAIHLGCVILGLFVIFAFLDRPLDSGLKIKKSLSMSSGQHCLATIRALLDWRLQLLLPLIIFTGLQQGFVLGDFTKSYLNCGLGIRAIGSVMICYGGVSAISSLAIGYMSHHIKRYAIMTSGTAFNTGLLVTLQWWIPQRNDPPMFYVVAACLGVCDAIWQTQTMTMFGLLFTEMQEAAFANYRMFQSLGLAAAFGYSYWLCVRTKVLIIAIVLVVSLLLYSLLERQLQRYQRRQDSTTPL